MTVARSYLIIANPTAGRGRSMHTAGRVAMLLESSGAKSRVAYTTERGHARHIAARAIEEHKQTDPLCIIACGGDGTMQEVAGAVATAKTDRVAMGLAPAGRCNDFAHAFGITRDPALIADVLLTGRPRGVDLGRIGDRWFCTIAALGFDAAVSRFVNEMRMPLRGAPAYVYGTLRELMKYRTPNLRLTGDFGAYVGPVFLAASAVTPRYGGAMRIAPDADPYDGSLDVCLVTRIRRLRVLSMLGKVVTGDHVALDEVRVHRTRILNAEPCNSSDVIEVWADGEPVSTLPVTIECVPNALNVILPAGASRRDPNE